MAADLPVYGAKRQAKAAPAPAPPAHPPRPEGEISEEMQRFTPAQVRVAHPSHKERGGGGLDSYPTTPSLATKEISEKRPETRGSDCVGN